jgi:autotransporter-associated beta strand protein
MLHPPDSLADFLLTFDSNTNISNVAHGLVTFGAWDDPSTPQIESRQFAAATYYTGTDWTYDQYVAEINAGRPVFLGWSSSTLGHATLGVGYNNTDGKHDVIVLTTWHQGTQEWQWTNETSSGYNLSVDSGVVMQPVGGPTPRLSAYFSIARDYIGDLTIELGVGDPQNPQWKTTVRSPDNSQDHNLAMTDINAMAELSSFRTSPQNWYLKVTNTLAQYPGTIQDFQIRYGLDQRVFYFTGGPVSLVANTAVYANLQTTPFAISSAWQGSGTSMASWGNDAAWDQGVPQYAGDTATLGNSIGSAANAIITLDGDRTISSLTFSNTAGGSYRIAQGSSGSLTLGNSAGPVPVTVTAGSHTIAAPVVLNSDVMISTSSSAAMTISAQVSGSRSLTKDGPGTLLLSATNTYSGGTTIAAGTLQLGDGTASNGAVLGDIVNNASLKFANPFAETFSGNISGSGSLEKAGTGALTLLGSNTYSGDTTVDSGVLAALGISGTGNTRVLAGATLQVNFLNQNQLTIGLGGLVVIGVITDPASNNSFLLPLDEGQGPSRATGIAASPDAGSANNSFTAAEPSTLMLMAIGALGGLAGFARQVRAEASKKGKE